VLAIGDAGRRELHRLRVWIGTRDGDQSERSLLLWELFECRRLTRDGVALLIGSLKSADEEHRRRRTRTAGDHRRLDGCPRRREANRPALASGGRWRDEQRRDYACKKKWTGHATRV
jgi:hypothetical protein